MEKFTTHKIGFDDYITGNRFIDICEETGATFCKTDYIHQYNKIGKKVFVTHERKNLFVTHEDRKKSTRGKKKVI